MSNIMDTLGNTETLFDGEVSYRLFGSDIYEAFAYMVNDRQAEPLDLVVQNHWGSLLIIAKYYPSQALVSTSTSGYAIDALKKALNERLAKRFTPKYPDQISILCHFEKGRFIVKAIISLKEVEV